MTIKTERLIRGNITLSREEEDILAKALNILVLIDNQIPVDAEFYDLSTGEAKDKDDLFNACAVIDYFRFNGRETEESSDRLGFVFSGHE